MYRIFFFLFKKTHTNKLNISRIILRSSIDVTRDIIQRVSKITTIRRHFVTGETDGHTPVKHCGSGSFVTTTYGQPSSG